MGAVNFFQIAIGKDADTAFRTAKGEAQYDFGHAGYTGTIAEKHSFIIYDAPPNMSAFKYAEMIENGNCNLFKIDPMYADTLKRAIDCFDDKWGASVCIPLIGKELKEYKQAHGLEKTRKKVFIFCGMASD